MSEENREAKANALVDEIDRQKGGRLTLFLGAAPGVGKTYAMLTRARELARRGMDIVAGIVETHGRPETAALLDGLVVIPLRQVQYRGHRLGELDIDALLARHPQIVLVDELAHRNAPGSRHERRWQDVSELLDAGIDVYSTVNVQHLESLNDIVFQITGVRVTETVPDSVFDRLRDIRLVDLPPHELIERLNQGKVYLPDQAQRALQAFFSPSNLTALRELAMQVAADRVDSDMRESQLARGFSGIALRRQVVVAIDGRGGSAYLVRMGRRIAERRDAPWIAVTVQRPEELVGQERQAEIDKAFELARSLGADTEILHGPNVAEALLAYSERTGVSTIVIGRTRERYIARLFGRTLTQQLLRRGAHYELVIIGGSDARNKARRTWMPPVSGFIGRHDISIVLMANALAVIVAEMAERWAGLNDLSMVFIVAVVAVAARTRMAAVLATAVLSFLCYNFFFIEPRYTLDISASRGLVTVAMFLVAALVAGRLASRLHQQVLALQAANTHATALQTLGRSLTGAADLGQVLRAGRASLEQALDAQVWLQVDSTTESTSGAILNDTEAAAARWVQSNGQVAGRFTDTLAASSWWFLPLSADKTTFGVAGLRFSTSTRKLTFELRRLAHAMVADIAQAALRTRMVADLESARVTGETEKLRASLLSSVSHDLRSPLAGIIGAAGSLASYSEAMTHQDRKDLLETIQQEGERLDRYIQNLLDMTRLGHEGLHLTRDWIGVDELVGSAVRRLQRYQPSAQLKLELAPDLPPIWVHPALIEQALFNVLENAVKFSPPHEPVIVRAALRPEGLRIDVVDRGPGIPEAERPHIFDIFYTVGRGDRGRQGTGLGLTICQGMIGAHGGRVEALPGDDGQGTTLRITLPLQTPAAPLSKVTVHAD